MIVGYGSLTSPNFYFVGYVSMHACVWNGYMLFFNHPSLVFDLNIRTTFLTPLVFLLACVFQLSPKWNAYSNLLQRTCEGLLSSILVYLYTLEVNFQEFNSDLGSFFQKRGSIRKFPTSTSLSYFYENYTAHTLSCLVSETIHLLRHWNHPQPVRSCWGPTFFLHACKTGNLPLSSLKCHFLCTKSKRVIVFTPKQNIHILLQASDPNLEILVMALIFFKWLY